MRTKANRDPEPSVAIIDSQSVASTEMGGEKGFTPHKQVKGRKRTILVDTLGLLLFVVIRSACIQDSDAAAYMLHETEARFPRLRPILVDQGYAQWVVEVAKHWFGYRLEVVSGATTALESRANVWVVDLEASAEQGSRADDRIE